MASKKRKVVKKTINFGDLSDYPDPIREVQKWWREPSTQKALHLQRRKLSRIHNVRLIVEIEQDDNS